MTWRVNPQREPMNSATMLDTEHTLNKPVQLWLPGRYGSGVAFVAELAISFNLMVTVLFTTNHETLARYNPYFVGALYAIYITFETPLSGMSMNPARTFWFRTSRQLLARTLAVFPCTNPRHVGRGRGFSSGAQQRLSVLCKGPPRQ